MKTIMEQANEIFEMTGDLKDMLERGDKLNKEEEKKIDFEYFLQEKFFEENPQTLDDMFPDVFNDWLENIDPQELIDYGQEYAEKIYNGKENK